ncbi:MAG: alpha/beta hydrolase [Candidatus Omnitrophica bacterium]|nr:alpha/beta hydrolase [Candidatus Omnitrophota bacterium]MBU1869849.1 alpha/beta hydrolase [Candidatus Omnitrophota bacterium]
MKLAKLFIGFVFLTLLFNQASAGVIKKEIDNFEYYLYVPKKYSPARPCPLIVALHSENEKASELAEKWRGASDYYGYIIACPKSTDQDKWETSEELGILQMLSDIDRDYSIDKSNIFVTGNSSGAMFTYYLGITYAGSFKAMAPFAGSLNPLLNSTVSLSENTKHIPVLILHGKYDQVTSINESYVARDKLRDNEYNVTLRELDGVGHEFPEKLSWQIIEWFEKVKRASR